MTWEGLSGLIGEGSKTLVFSHDMTFWASIFRPAKNKRLFYGFVVYLFGEGECSGLELFKLFKPCTALGSIFTVMCKLALNIIREQSTPFTTF